MRRECVAVEDRRVQHSNRGPNSESGSDLCNFFAKTGFRSNKILAALCAIAIRNCEGHLCVEQSLAGTLQRQELPGLAFELFDSRSSSLRHRPKKSDAHSFQSHRL